MVSTEKRIVAACLKSRCAYEQIKDHLDDDALTHYSTLLLKIVDSFYNTDSKADHVDLDFVQEKLNVIIDNPSKVKLHADLAKECFAIDISALNVAGLLLENKRKEQGNALAQKLANGRASPEELEAHIKLLKASSIDEEDKDDETEILHNVSIDEINKEVLNKEGLIQFGTKVLTGHIDGGAMPGHHVLILARPEMGKTALTLSCARTLVKQKLKGLYFGNEDPIRAVVERFQGCLTGMPRLDRLRDPKAAQAVLEAQGYGYAKFISIAPGSLYEIEKHVAKEEPQWIIVDQIRNLNTKAENRTNQLEAIATGMRNLCKKHGLLGFSVTQAGDSASNKRILEMGDVDSSNTGIPAQADLMIGLGADKAFEEQNLRTITLIKNKMSGAHVNFTVKINPYISRIEDI